MHCFTNKLVVLHFLMRPQEHEMHVRKQKQQKKKKKQKKNSVLD